MADRLTDEEQLQVLKNWWKENGTSLIAVIVIGAGSYFGWQWWKNYERSYAEGAAAIYSEMTSAIEIPVGAELSDESLTTAQFLIAQLQDDYSKTQYAVNASFHGAKLAVDNNDLDKAAESLNWIIDNRDDESAILANLRLARVLFAQEKYSDALSLVDYSGNDQFTALFADVRGDILLAQGEEPLAKAAYEQALEQADQQSPVFRRLVQVKLFDLGHIESN